MSNEGQENTETPYPKPQRRPLGKYARKLQARRAKATYKIWNGMLFSTADKFQPAWPPVKDDPNP